MRGEKERGQPSSFFHQARVAHKLSSEVLHSHPLRCVGPSHKVKLKHMMVFGCNVTKCGEEKQIVGNKYFCKI